MSVESGIEVSVELELESGIEASVELGDGGSVVDSGIEVSTPVS